MPYFECAECGAVKFARKWCDCLNHKQPRGMALVTDWGKYKKPEREATKTICTDHPLKSGE